MPYVAYFDCSSGISGDMILGALVDAGVPFDRLRDELRKIKIKGYELKKRRVKRSGLRATKIDVIIKNNAKAGHIREWKDVKEIINNSDLSSELKKKGLGIFKRLFEAEAHVHGTRYDRVHLHELGAIDCIIDILGSLICLDLLGIDAVYASSINVGSGSIKTEHGILPVPAPATVRLLQGIPVYSGDIKFELTTPTGAAIISSIANGFGTLPLMRINSTGTGAGDRDFSGHPNILRVFTGELIDDTLSDTQKVCVIETNIDDMNPEVYGYVMERLFDEGALDVYLTHILMKKGRPGIKVSVICDPDKKDNLINILLHETTTLGVRYVQMERKILKRDTRYIDLNGDRVRVKISRDGSRIRIAPEYEDCRKIALKRGRPLIEIIEESIKVADSLFRADRDK